MQNLFSKAEAATATFAQDVFTESASFETKASAVFGNEAPWQVFTNLPEGVTIQKWVEAKKPAWVDVTAFPQAFPVMDFTKQLALRAVKNSNTIKVTIDPTVVQGDVAALFKSFGKVRSLPLSDQAPAAVQELAATATGVGELTVSWEAPATGAATSYTVTMTTMAGTGSSTQTQVTANPSLAYTGLAPSNSYSFSVTASNAAETGIAAQTSFGQAPILFPLGPSALTTGLDGSVWVTQDSGFIDGIDTGLVKDMLPGAVQQIVNNNGVWTAQPAIGVGNGPIPITTGLDGSIWVANVNDFTVQQIVVPPQSGPTNLAAVFGPAAGQMTLAWQPPPANGGSPAVSYTATVAQGDSFQTITTSSTSVVFDGLTLGSGTTYFTVTAANFAGVSATVSHQIDAAGNTIPPQPYIASGLAIDGTPFPGGGFDGDGYYYYSGNLGSTITWSGATFQFGPVPNSKNGQNNFVQAKGQSINLPQGDYGWLYLAGAAANGNQQNQPITLTFTDGSTAPWTQSFSDWCGPQNYAGETIIQMQPNRVNQVGNVHSQTNYVYGYAYQIPAGKTLASVKLPNNSNNLGILGMSML